MNPRDFDYFVKFKSFYQTHTANVNGTAASLIRFDSRKKSACERQNAQQKVIIKHSMSPWLCIQTRTS